MMTNQEPLKFFKQCIRRLINLILLPLPSFIWTQNNTVLIEGGLGSQLLTYIEFSEKRAVSPKIRCNTEYFSIPESKKSANLSYWRWELDSYGISRDSLNPYSEKLSKLQRIICEEKKFQSKQFLANWSVETSFKYKSIFPIDPKKTDRIKEIVLGDIATEYSVVHVRRGDYLYLASHLVPLQTYLKFISQITKELPKKLVFISDSEFSNDEKRAITNTLQTFSINFLDSKIYTGREIHDFMRMASFLICANSTFSFSAGLLACESSKVYFPVQFYTPSENQESNPFLAVSDFALMRPF